MAWKNLAGIDLHREYPADGTRPGSGTRCLLVTMTHASKKEALGTRFSTLRSEEAVQQKHGTLFYRLTPATLLRERPGAALRHSTSRRHTVWPITGARPRILPNYSAFRRLKSSNSARKDSASSVTALEKRKYGSRTAIFFSGSASGGNLQSMGLSPTPS